MFRQPKRQRTERVFHVTVNGQQEWTEPADDRSMAEFQHELATERFPGKLVRVEQKFQTVKTDDGPEAR
jgi:hypothetical protein